MPPPAAALYYSVSPGPDLRPRGQARHAPGRIRPPYPRGVPLVRYPGGADCHFIALQVVRFGVVTAWLQPQSLDFDAGVGVGLPTTPLPPAVPGPLLLLREVPPCRWFWLTR